MTISLDELIERIHRALVQDAYDTNDIVLLMDICMKQRATIERLAGENEALTQDNARLVEAVATAGRYIESLEGFSHLAQYAEETAK